MKRFLLVWIGLFLFSGLAYATEERPTLGLEGGAFPLINQPVNILVSHASYPDLEKFELTATYRPNSSTSFVEKLPAPNDMGRVEWIPKEAGIATLTAIAPELKGVEDGNAVKLETNVSVRYGSFPMSGILIFLLAALTLFGGLIVTLLASRERA